LVALINGGTRTCDSASPSTPYVATVAKDSSADSETDVIGGGSIALPGNGWIAAAVVATRSRV
jgi:hypothetical protein